MHEGMMRSQPQEAPRLNRELLRRRFETVLQEKAVQMNELLGAVRDFRGNAPVIDKACRINPRSFTDSKSGGPYPKEKTFDSISHNEARVLDLELKQCGIIDRRSGEFDSILANHRGVSEESCVAYQDWCSAHPDPDPDKTPEKELVLYRHKRKEVQEKLFEPALRAWQREKEATLPALTELAVLRLLQKYLGDAYVVVRSAKYDDYVNGIDTVVLNRETGEVLCTFDELYDDQPTQDKDESRYEEKWRKNRNRITSGEGFSLKYGLEYQDGAGEKELVRTAVSDVSTFPVRLKPEELLTILQEEAIFGEEKSEIERTALLGMLTEAAGYMQSMEEARGGDSKRSHLANIRTLIEAVERAM